MIKCKYSKQKSILLKIKSVILENVLFVQQDDENSLIGQPLLKNVKVEAEIVNTYKDEKVIDFVKRRRKNSRRKNGHRQTKTQLKILDIKIA